MLLYHANAECRWLLLKKDTFCPENHDVIYFEIAVLSSTVRLVGGSWKGEGRVEVFHNGIWGTVCDDDWDIKDATVVCRQLGSLNAVSAPRSARFGAGSGQIWLDNVGCSGSESSIENCPHNGWGIENCDHGEDASVIVQVSYVDQDYSRVILSIANVLLFKKKIVGRKEKRL